MRWPFGKKKDPIRDLEERIERLRLERAGARDAAGQARGDQNLTKSLEQALKNQKLLQLQAQLQRMEEQTRQETHRAEEEAQILRARLGQPLALAILTPTDGASVARGGSLAISWTSSGPVGQTLVLRCTKNGQPYGIVGQVNPYRDPSEAMTWSVPRTYPEGGGYRIQVQDSESGITAESSEFQIT